MGANGLARGRIGLSAATLIGFATLATGSGGDPPPNIVVIMVDDISMHAFAAYGGETYSTPQIDQFAAEGRKFWHCYAQPMCSPSRSKIMTGKYNYRNYYHWGTIAESERTFADVVKDQGYTTCVVGKWQLWQEEWGAEADPGDLGFDDYLVWDYLEGGDRYWQPVLNQNGAILPTTPDDYGPDICRDFILDFIEANQAGPFLVYYPMILVHQPIHSPPGSPPDQTAVEQYADMVTYADKIVGEILAHLDALGLSEQTIVLFTGDNGSINAATMTWQGQTVTGDKGDTTDMVAALIEPLSLHAAALTQWPLKVCRFARPSYPKLRGG